MAGRFFSDPWNGAWVGTTGYYQDRDKAGNRQQTPRHCEHFALVCLPRIQPTLMYLRMFASVALPISTDGNRLCGNVLPFQLYNIQCNEHLDLSVLWNKAKSFYC